MKRFVYFLFAVSLWAGPAVAWNSEGHRIVALLAQQQLSPEALRYIQTILRSHPYPSVRDLSAASVWPDQVRSDPKYHHGAWHYVNFPLILGGQKKDALTSGPRFHVSGEVNRALNECTVRLKDERLSSEERAVALSWVVHLIGDIHQPLHAASAYSVELPKGDRGGNKFPVQSKGRKTSLHKFWDSGGGLFDSHPDDGQILQIIGEWRQSFSDEVPGVAVLSPTDWTEESYRLARDVSYRDVALGSPLTDSYVATTRSVSQERLLLAGYRLGAYLQRIYEAHRRATL